MLRYLSCGGLWLACALASMAGTATAQVTPIPSVAVPAPTPYLGTPALSHPIKHVPGTPQNPFMASNGDSEIHDDGWQTDAYRWPGPMGRSPQTLSTLLVPMKDCGSITFDSRGRVISICIGITGPQLYMFDPHTLETLATFSLPPRTAEDVLLNPNIFQDFSNGGYFFLDNRDEVVTGTTSGQIWVIAETGGGGAPGFRLVRAYPLGLHQNEEITSQLPDARGLVWFTARQDGVVGTLNLGTGAVHVLRLGSGADGEITKSLAVDAAGGVYIPTNHRLYRFVAGAAGVPKVSWQIGYPNDGVAKPGQLDAGTGTTPVVSGAYVAINDNADPMDVMIYRNAPHPTRVVRVHVRIHGHWRWRRRRRPLGRVVCRVPVFKRGQSADENAMIAAGRSYVIENNYGYTGPSATTNGGLTAPGVARVEVNQQGTGCRLVWTNTTVRAPSVVSKLSLANGLIYTYTIAPGSSDPWYWTALDFRTGRVVWQQYAGSGLGYNNNYSGIAISSSGTEYLGTLGGMVAMRDGGALTSARSSRPRSGARRVGRRPCDIYARAGTPCVAAFSSTRALFAGYAGRLYELKRASDGATLDIGVLMPGGYANARAQKTFCAGTRCVVQKIYDQTSDHNDLVPQGPTTALYSNTTFSHNPVSAGALPILAGGHPVYGLKFQSGSPTGLPCPTAATCIGNHGQAYNNGHRRAKGVAVSGQPESVYAVFGGTYSGSDCCFDFGNSEIKGTDDGNGTMDALNFSRDCWDACGPNGGPWVQADLENGMFMTGTPTRTPESPTAWIGGSFQSGDGFCCAATSRNRAMHYPFVTGMLNNPGSKTFTLKGAKATTGGLMTFYRGRTPPGKGYSPMRQEGAIILGSGGDQGTTDGEFFEGVMTRGVPPAAAEAAVQANIVRVGYRLR